MELPFSDFLVLLPQHASRLNFYYPLLYYDSTMYWSNAFYPLEIVRSSMGGNQREKIADVQGILTNIALDYIDRKLYWSDGRNT